MQSSGASTVKRYCENCGSRFTTVHSDLCPKGKAVNKGQELLTQVLQEKLPKPRKHGRKNPTPRVDTPHY